MSAAEFGGLESAVDPVRRWQAALGVTEHASHEEIKRAYRRAVKQTHPDLHPHDASASARFRYLQEAYEALTRPEQLPPGVSRA
jgi:DnaJ-class molecular chaperone